MEACLSLVSETLSCKHRKNLFSGESLQCFFLLFLTRDGKTNHSFGMSQMTPMLEMHKGEKEQNKVIIHRQYKICIA